MGSDDRPPCIGGPAGRMTGRTKAGGTAGSTRMTVMRSWICAAVAGAGFLVAAGAASAQENLDAGKSGAQLYQSNCAICHKSPQALNKSGGGLFGLDSFLREHYTSSRESAAAISAYLNTVGGGPADARPAKKKSSTAKKKEPKADGKDGKAPEAKPDEKKPDAKKPEEKSSGDKPSDSRPSKKEGGKAALLSGAALRGCPLIL